MTKYCHTHKLRHTSASGCWYCRDDFKRELEKEKNQLIEVKRKKKRKPGGGRKKMHPDEKRSVFFSLKISENELSEIKLKAKSNGLKLHDYLRGLLGITKRRFDE